MKADYLVGIIGTGFAGLTAALRLKKEGESSFIMFERASEVGGTWRDNIYPGCACDVASPLYSFSSVPNPNWSNLYSSQPEILSYIKNTVAASDLEKHIKFNSDIVEVRFSKEGGLWQVTDRAGEITTVSVLLLGLGPLNRPNIPKFAGLETFEGHYFHTGEWQADVDFTGKRVAVIGTGASAVQVIPEIAPFVQHLTVIQRTPAYVVSRDDKKLGTLIQKIFAKFPFVQRGLREFLYWINELGGLGFIGSTLVNRIIAWTALRKLRKQVKDPELREKLTPKYTIGCKRILKSDDYYPALNRSNVRLVTEPIQRFTKTGIVTNDGTEHLIDVAIFATGFIAADFNLYIKIFDAHGKDLIEAWKSTGPEAYLGTTVSGYPNMAILLGPNTGLGHNSVVHMMESQMNYIIKYIKYIQNCGDGCWLDVKPVIQQEYNKQIQKKLEKTVWASGCKSWYLNSNGKNTTVYPGLTVTFRKATKNFDASVYMVQKQPVQTAKTNSIIA